MNQRLFAKLTRPLLRRVQGMIARAVLSSIDASTMRQVVKVKLLDGEIADGVEYFEPYGFTGVPTSGDGLALFIGGNRSHGAAICLGGKRHRPTDLQPGETCIYTQDGDEVRIKRGGTIQVTAATKLVIDAPDVECTGNLTAAGEVTAGPQQIGLTTHLTSGVVPGGGTSGPPVPGGS